MSSSAAEIRNEFKSEVEMNVGRSASVGRTRLPLCCWLMCEVHVVYKMYVMYRRQWYRSIGKQREGGGRESRVESGEYKIYLILDLYLFFCLSNKIQKKRRRSTSYWSVVYCWWFYDAC
jgi:hypothetical protein